MRWGGRQVNIYACPSCVAHIDNSREAMKYSLESQRLGGFADLLLDEEYFLGSVEADAAIRELSRAATAQCHRRWRA